MAVPATSKRGFRRGEVGNGGFAHNPDYDDARLGYVSGNTTDTRRYPDADDLRRAGQMDDETRELVEKVQALRDEVGALKEKSDTSNRFKFKEGDVVTASAHPECYGVVQHSGSGACDVEWVVEGAGMYPPSRISNYDLNHANMADFVVAVQKHESAKEQPLQIGDLVAIRDGFKPASNKDVFFGFIEEVMGDDYFQIRWEVYPPYMTPEINIQGYKLAKGNVSDYLFYWRKFNEEKKRTDPQFVVGDIVLLAKDQYFNPDGVRCVGVVVDDHYQGILGAYNVRWDMFPDMFNPPYSPFYDSQLEKIPVGELMMELEQNRHSRDMSTAEQLWKERESMQKELSAMVERSEGFQAALQAAMSKLEEFEKKEERTKSLEDLLVDALAKLETLEKRGDDLEKKRVEQEELLPVLASMQKKLSKRQFVFQVATKMVGNVGASFVKQALQNLGVNVDFILKMLGLT